MTHASVRSLVRRTRGPWLRGVAIVAVLAVGVLPAQLDARPAVEDDVRVAQKAVAALVDSAAARTEHDPEAGLALGLRAYDAARGGGFTDLAAEARFLTAEAWSQLDSVAAAVHHYREAIDLWTPRGTWPRVARANNRLGDLLKRSGRLDEAATAYLASIEAYRAASDDAGVAESSNDLGLVYWHVGRFEEAVEYYQAALALWEMLGDQDNLGRAHNNLGVIFYRWAAYERAIEHYRRSLEIRKALGAARGTAIVLNNLGKTYHDFGQYDRALAYYDEAYGYAQTLEADPVLGYTLHNLAETHAVLGEVERALAGYDLALAAYRAASFTGGLLETQIGKGTLLGKMGRAEEAFALLGATLDAARAHQLAVMEATALQRLGTLHAAAGDQRAALARFHESLVVSERMDMRDLMRDTYALISSSHEARGEPAEALYFFKRYAAEEERIFGDRTARLVTEVEARHAAQRTADANILLRRDGERRNLILLFISLTLLVVLTAAFGLYRAYRQKRHLNRRLEASNQQVVHERDQQKALLQILSHDLANPLGSIRGCLELMIDEPETVSELGPMALMVTRQGIDTIQLVRDMQLLDRDTLALEPVALDRAARDAMLSLRSRLEEKGMKVDLDLDPDLSVWAERRSLANSVIANLLSNAIKFSTDRGRIVLRAEVHGDEVHLCVCDEGIGIPDEARPFLFDMHRNSSRAGTRGESGSGFGLPLVGRFVRRYGGRIEVTSRTVQASPEDHGTEVRVVLRAAPATQRVPSPPPLVALP